MSVRKRELAFTEDAQQDILSLLLYTREHWGVRQRDRYRAILDNAFALILSNPLIGLAREDLRAGLRTRDVERHIIYYRVEGEFVRVLRVMHQRVNPVGHRFGEPEGE